MASVSSVRFNSDRNRTDDPCGSILVRIDPMTDIKIWSPGMDSSIAGHDVDSLVSLWGSTIKSP